VTTNTPRVWNHDFLGDGPVALTLIDSASPDAPAAPLLGAAGNGLQSFVLRSPQFGPFLGLHAAVHLVCHDAGVLHRTLHDHLIAAGDLLWRFAREGRLHDVALLHQLIRLAEIGGRCPPPMGLADLAHQYANEALPDAVRLQASTAATGVAADHDSALAAVAIRHAEAILKVFSTLSYRLQTPGLIHSDSRAPAGFGPPSLAVQVQGAIAVAHAARDGLRLAPAAIGRITAGLDAVTKRYEAILAGDRDARQCFKRGVDRSFKYRPEGSPEVKTSILKGWLGRVCASLEGLHRTALNPRSGRDGRPSAAPEDWGVLVHFHPLLQAWAALTAAATTPHSLNISGTGTVRTDYEILPHLQSRRPDLAALRRFMGGGLFVPTVGYSFLTVRLKDLELRALAVECRQSFGGSRLADLFIAGKDPHDHAAAELAGLSLSDFTALQAREPVAHARWLRISRFLLETVPTGLSVECLRAAPRLGYGLGDLGLSEIQKLHSKLVNEVFPELAGYLRDDTLVVMAGNLNVSPAALEGAIAACGRPNPPSLSEFRRWFGGDTRRLTDDRRRQLQILLQVQNANDSLRPLIKRETFDQELYTALFSRRVTGATGRSRGGMLFCDARTALYQDLADDAVEIALYGLVERGFRLAAYAAGEILLETPAADDAGQAAQEALQVTNDAVEKALQGVPAGCEVERGVVWPAED